MEFETKAVSNSNMKSNGSGWMYFDSTSNSQKGPFPVPVLTRLLEKGILGIDAFTLAWTPGMETWLPMKDIPEFKDIITFHSKMWYYLDEDNNQRGPIYSRNLLHKIKEGELDGLSLIYEIVASDSVGEWKKMSEIDELKQQIRKIAEEENAIEVARQNAEEAAMEYLKLDKQQQIFIPDEVFDSKAYGIATQASSKHDVIRDEQDLSKKSFVADNGTRYKWDDEEEDWVEVDEDEESEYLSLETDNKEQGDHDEGRKRQRDMIDDDADEEEDEKEGAMETSETGNGQDATTEKKKRKPRKKKSKNSKTWVYVQGLPHDVTAEEINNHFSKVGILALSPYDQQPRIKIYREPEDSTRCKGDCILCYNAEESVQIAIDILNDGYIRPKYQIKVSKANFDAAVSGGRGGGGGAGAERRPAGLTQAQIKVAKNAAKQALTWNEDDDIGVSKSAALRIIVLEGMFSPKDFSEDPTFEDDLQSDIATECEKFGPIEKLTLFSKNPRGVVVVKFGTSFAAQECIRIMNGRYFGGQKIKCYFWDGVTNYSIVSAVQIEEEQKQEEARLDEFGDWLEKDQENLPEEFQLRTE